MLEGEGVGGLGDQGCVVHQGLSTQGGGQHTEEILRSAGYTAERIAQLLNDGVIRTYRATTSG
ncbi:hypothetical protein [Saccharopolyspora pogona]|uniref:hypothetical protein n=1 Tax=Saccharopolyspora pogona TaxID=333966 RepID=UPI001683318C|nr:hypothetical protein [Saccharopolyspora pogona]